MVEEAALDWFRALGYHVVGGPDQAPGPHALRKSYADVMSASAVRGALRRLNSDLSEDALDDALRKLTQPAGTTLEARNRSFHRMLVDGVAVEYRAAGGAIRGAQVRVIDFDEPDANTWTAINQFTVTESGNTRRPDIVVFVNDLPLAVIELKNPADENATIWSAFQQLQTYKAELPSLFACNAVLAVSDGMQARVGTLSAGREWFKPWRTIDGQELAPAFYTELQVLVEGVFEKRRFLSLLRDFIVFEDDSGALAKKMAGYHQFHAVQAAVGETLRAAALQEETRRIAETGGRYEAGRQPGGDPGDRRIGVVWHTQGSGKSLTMAFYAGRIIREPAMANPTVVVLTDRNDLDAQLFGTFARCQDLLRQPPVQAVSRADLRAKLAVEAGGVVFTTIQKFFPEEKGDRYPLLSRRRNIVVIADEAHRSQYDFIDGYARHMRDALPNASFIGFTGTPIELQDANTRAVFGDYISVYDIQRAVEDRATVPIYYESRLAKLTLDERERPKIDPGFEEATEGEEVDRREKLKTRWAQLEAIVGAERRLKLVAGDIVAHFDQRLEAMEVRGMERRNLAVELLQKLLKGELAARRRKNVVQARSFAEMLEQTLRRYQNRAVEAAQVIEELIQLARDMREAGARGEHLGLSDDELAFYDALETNDSAVQVLGDETLRDIARELVDTVRRNVTIDWTLRENVRANLRRLVKRILRKHGYPPDKQEKATRTVLEQAEALSAGWAAET